MTSSLKYSVSAFGLLLASAAFAAPAQAADVAPMAYDTWYVSVFGGFDWARAHASFSTDHYDFRMKNGFTVGAAVGSYVADGVRMERELSFVSNGFKGATYDDTPYEPESGDMSGIFMMTNLWKDFRTSSAFQPYVGGGIGLALLSGDGTGETSDFDFDNELAFAVQAGAGVRYAMTDRLALDLGYRFKGAIDATEKASPDYSGAFSFYNHSIQAGLTYAFRGNGVVMPPAAGDSGVYLSLFGGAAFPDTMSWEYEGSIYALDQKTGFTVGAAAGTQLAPGLRGEAEVSYVNTNLSGVEFDAASPDVASGDVNQFFFLLNVWKDFDFGMLRPYVGGGVGFGAVTFDNADATGELSSKTGVGIAGQFGFGARMPVTDNFSMDVGYRYKSIIDAMIRGGGGWDYNYDIATHNHILQVGGTYDFGGTQQGESAEMTNNYVSVFGGLAQIVDTHFNYTGSDYVAEFKSGFTVGAALGGNINENLRGELEVSFVNGDSNAVFEDDTLEGTGGEVDTFYLLANLWRDFDMGPFKPYVGGGVGLSLVDVTLDMNGNDPIDDRHFALAGQLGTGIRFNLTDSLSIDAGYRLKAALGTFSSGTGTADHTMATYYTHVGQLGLVWNY